MLIDPKSTEGVSSTPFDEVLDVAKRSLADTQTAEEHENALESSPEADGKETVSEKDWDPLSVVKKALGESQEDTEGKGGDPSKQSDGSSKSENDGQKPDGATEELGEITQEELDSYKPTTRKRIEKLLDDRQRLNERLLAVEPAAEQMDVLQTFMQERNLTPANVSELMVVGGLAMSSDPKDLRQALARVDTFRNQIMTQLGDVLPEDLQKKVEDGLMDADTAKGVALERVDHQRATVKAEQAETTVKTVQTQAQVNSETTAKQLVHSTIADWTNQKASSDPDYPRKAELLQKEIRLRVAAEGGKVLDKDKAVKIANDAYAEVDRIFKAISPPKALQPKRMLPSKANKGNMASTPNSALEAARAGLQKTAG